MSQDELREFGYAPVSKRGPQSLAVTIPARARKYGGIEADERYRITVDQDRRRATYVKNTSDSVHLDGTDYGPSTVRGTDSGVYVTLSPKLLDLLGVGYGDKVSVEVGRDGTFALEPW